MSRQNTTPQQSPEDRFWSKVDKGGDCWVWTAGRIKRGYGRFRMYGRRYLAHRVAYLLSVGPIPDGMGVLHRCDNPPCCNPAHLFLGTDADNSRDMVTKGRNAYGERSGTAKLCEADVMDMRYFHSTGMSFARLGSLYGVSERACRSAIERETWARVP